MLHAEVEPQSLTTVLHSRVLTRKLQIKFKDAIMTRRLPRDTVACSRMQTSDAPRMAQLSPYDHILTQRDREERRRL
jgi:hypothetical protein